VTDSRVPGFYKLTVPQRLAAIAERSGVSEEQLAHAVASGAIDAELWDKVVENVVGVYALPFALALNFTVNGADRLVPMVVEEPSVVAAASNAARMVRAGGGFTAEVPEELMIGQIEVFDVADADAGLGRLGAARAELLESATRAAPGIVPFGGGPRDIEVRDLGERRIVVHVLVDCRDAMGANTVNTIAEAIGPRVAELAGGRLGLRILSNLADRRRVKVSCRVPARELVARLDGADTAGVEQRGQEFIDAIVQGSRFAEVDPYRAVTHNKGIMNGLDAVVLATGNDWRAVEAGAHAYASRSGVYRPLSTWRRDGAALVGTLELPLALGTVGGTLRVHPGARAALELMQVKGAGELAMIAAAAGLASNLAAVRALATEGIQRGHMALHARSVAVSVGAEPHEVDALARRLAASGHVTVDAARDELAKLRAPAGC
jgi:hydroxymethylglutaryl-CoA reductase